MCWWIRLVVKGGGLDYVPCFRNFDVCSICMGVGVVGLVVQVGNYVVGSCWRKVGVCGVVGVCVEEN